MVHQAHRRRSSVHMNQMGNINMNMIHSPTDSRSKTNRILRPVRSTMMHVPVTKPSKDTGSPQVSSSRRINEI